MPGQTGDAIHATNKLQEAFPDDEALGLSEVRFREWQDVARIMIARPPLWRAIVAVAEALPRSGRHLDGPTATAIIEAAMKHEGP